MGSQPESVVHSFCYRTGYQNFAKIGQVYPTGPYIPSTADAGRKKSLSDFSYHHLLSILLLWQETKGRTINDLGGVGARAKAGKIIYPPPCWEKNSITTCMGEKLNSTTWKKKSYWLVAEEKRLISRLSRRKKQFIRHLTRKNNIPPSLLGKKLNYYLHGEKTQLNNLKEKNYWLVAEEKRLISRLSRREKKPSAT